jgi:glycosyltransferase involved in cell wall biosynthesis
MSLIFKIIIPCYNSEKWIQKSIDSLYNQTYKNWECIIINDASTDNTLKVIKLYLQTIGDDLNKFRIFERTQNVGALENIVYGINLICDNDEDVIVLLDGDDWLASNDVLEYLNCIYQDPNIWLTYGQYIRVSSNTLGNNKPLVNTRNYRAEGDWYTSHLRTFKYKIWKRIRNEDLKMANSKFYSMAWDLAILYPLIEMSGMNRIKYIDKVLYCYNDDNPINDHKKDVKLQLKLAREIKNKLKYKELP